VSAAQDPNVLAYRIERLRKGPRNWIFWVALFTALNGVFLALGQDVMILAGLVVPFAWAGWSAHLFAALLLSGLAYFARKVNALALVGVSIYVLDTVFAVIAKLWSGVIMHVVILLFMALTLNAARVLAKQQSPGPIAGPQA